MRPLAADITELEFCRWLFDRYGQDVTSGDTTLAERRTRARALLLRMGEYERRDSQGRTPAQAFEKAFGQPLIPAPPTDHHENGDGV